MAFMYSAVYLQRGLDINIDNLLEANNRPTNRTAHLRIRGIYEGIKPSSKQIPHSGGASRQFIHESQNPLRSGILFLNYLL